MTILELLNQKTEEIEEEFIEEFEDSSSEEIEEAKHTRPDEYIRHWVEYPKDEKHYSSTGKRVYGIWKYGHKEAMGVGQSKDTVVHHKDGNKHNNDPSNLEVCSRAEHCKIDPNARKYFNCKIPGCKGKHYAQHLCLKHYMQKYRKAKGKKA